MLWTCICVNLQYQCCCMKLVLQIWTYRLFMCSVLKCNEHACLLNLQHQCCCTTWVLQIIRTVFYVYVYIQWFAMQWCSCLWNLQCQFCCTKLVLQINKQTAVLFITILNAMNMHLFCEFAIPVVLLETGIANSKNHCVSSNMVWNAMHRHCFDISCFHLQCVEMQCLCICLNL